ncbi:uncharacterized protein BT62DRAFT_921355 [Guyanagaster necrorhizus]|uniref:Uncharacterized protein n=1 Tax=Guyanagaster necrorhizus TaxID=856835 RepID=A0A9P8AQP2_9AGAR|nr:uncharacterized protein BT62DRAFT_921355 [Guyanagaster necrorhizus MCA 3950]KAG7444066.1 hypothetical protein BT62DRAFT_921355 [Guyanagaster necrorhizus MCA 3950]
MSNSVSNMMSGDSRRVTYLLPLQQGQLPFNFAKGTVKEVIGNAVGSDSMARDGKKEHTDGEAETTATKVQGYAKATADCVIRYGQFVVGLVTGNTSDKMADREGQGRVRDEQVDVVL